MTLFHLGRQSWYVSCTRRQIKALAEVVASNITRINLDMIFLVPRDYTKNTTREMLVEALGAEGLRAHRASCDRSFKARPTCALIEPPINRAQVQMLPAGTMLLN